MDTEPAHSISKRGRVGEGRPTLYTPELANRLADHIAAGLTDEEAAAIEDISALATVLGSAWESGITFRRVKALIFAVVARGMGCEACEAEAAEALRHEKWTDAEIKHLLMYLTSEKLDPFELRVLRFARETIRYQTRRVQELAQRFATGIKREVLI